MPESTGHLPARASDGEPKVRELPSWPPAESLAVTKALLIVGGRRGVVGVPRPGFTTDPSELLPVGNRPLLFHCLDWFDAAGIRDVALAVDRRVEGLVSDAVTGSDDWSLEVSCFAHDVEGGLGHAVSLAEEVLDRQPFLLHLGDSLARTPLSGLAGDLALGQSDAILFVDGGQAAGDDVVDLSRGRLASIVRGLTPASPGALAGVAIFGAGALDAVRAVPSAGDYEIEMLSAAERLSLSGGQVETQVLNGWWRFRGQPDALLDANRFVLEGMDGRPIPAGLQGSNIQGSVSIHDSAVIKSTTIRGPAIIGPNARLTDAYVGPYTSIGEGVVVEGAEIEHSIVLPGARISYLGGRLEASVIGAGARLFRDFRLPRALRLRVGEGAEVSLA